MQGYDFWPVVQHQFRDRHLGLVAFELSEGPGAPRPTRDYIGELASVHVVRFSSLNALEQARYYLKVAASFI